MDPIEEIENFANERWHTVTFVLPDHTAICFMCRRFILSGGSMMTFDLLASCSLEDVPEDVCPDCSLMGA